MKNRFAYSHYDAVVIGARCAGAATALLMARAGARVLIVDREADMQDTLSTHALMRPAISLLKSWGVLETIAAAGTPLVTNAQFHYGPERVDVPVKPDAEITGLYAPRRWLLDRILREAAVEAGVELHTGVSLESLNMDQSGRVVGAELFDGMVRHVSADTVIGADGRRSKVAELVKAQTFQTSTHSTAVAYGYVGEIANEGYRFYFGDGITAGLIPTTAGLHCFFAGCRPKAFGALFEDGLFAGATRILANWEPALAARISSRSAVEPMRRYMGAPGHIRQCAGAGWALVGDAGYFKDPATAHGITDAFLDASRLVRALSRTPGDARPYQNERDRFASRFFEVTQNIASLDWDFEGLKALHADLNACMKAEHPSLGNKTLHPIAA